MWINATSAAAAAFAAADDIHIDVHCCTGITFDMQVFSRCLVLGSARSSIFTWAVVNAIGAADDDDDEGFSHCYSHHHRMLQALADALFDDMYPSDCTGIDWEVIGSSSSSSSSSSAPEHAAAAACRVLLMAMDAAAWTNGVVLTHNWDAAAANAAAAGINYDCTSWISSTSYRCLQAQRSH